MEPEELERIEKEERARFAIRQRIEQEAAAAKSKADGQNLLSGCGLILAIGFVFWLGATILMPGCGSGKKVDLNAALNAGAAYQEERIVIENRDSEPWLEVRIEVNGTWEFNTGAIPAGMTMRYLPQVFAKSDGTRLNPAEVSVRRIDIHATTSKGRAHWNGSY